MRGRAIRIDREKKREREREREKKGKGGGSIEFDGLKGANKEGLPQWCRCKNACYTTQNNQRVFLRVSGWVNGWEARQKEKGREGRGGGRKELQKTKEQGEVLLFFAVRPLHLDFVLQMVYDYALSPAPSLLFHHVKPSLFLGEKEIKRPRTYTLTRARALLFLFTCIGAYEKACRRRRDNSKKKKKKMPTGRNGYSVYLFWVEVGNGQERQGPRIAPFLSLAWVV